MKKNVVVIFGGHNTEYYASCDSVGGMIDEFDENLFNIIKLGVTIEGDWILTNATAEEISDGKGWLKRKDNKRAIISPERNKNELLILDDKIETLPIDCVFPLISGYGGEDGCIQGLLELSNIPFVGAGVASSANSMDKALTRLFADLAGLKQPGCIVLTNDEYTNANDIEKGMNFNYPVFVKPASLGSSVGITKAQNVKELEDSINEAFKYENKILVEEGIEGTEIKVALLGNEEVEAGAICELIVPKGQINDYAMKHINFTSTKNIPANLDIGLEKQIIEEAIAIYKAVDCKGFARVDFFLTPDNQLYFNEINTVPGIGKHSIYSVMFEKNGVELKEVLTKLINLALENKKQVIF